MADLLLELFSEEIPARMQAAASADLAALLSKALAEHNLPAAISNSYVTPRRLALIVKDLPVAQADATIEKKGPKTSAPQAAIDGFLKSSGLTLDKLEKRMVGKDETYFAVVHQKGRASADVLKEIIEKILANFPWPKSMRWGSGNISWVRPLHSILCLFDGKIVPVEFAGIKASHTTYGHRFLSPQAITITKPDEYVTKLKTSYVIAGHDERKAEILRQIEAVAGKHSLTLRRDDGLLAEVTGLVEWPTVLMGTIDAKFMDLPPEVLTSEMRAHQKYFALLCPSSRGTAFAAAKDVSKGSQAIAQDPALPLRGPQDDSTFSDKFLIVSNMITTDGGKAVVAGNERVLRARLSDGRFFFDQDRKKSLSDWAEGLKGVTFHAKIGTIADKVTRIEKLAATLAETIDADKKLVLKASSLCKADLTTGMVGEFPELQGVMGRYYALAQNEDAAVADAIRDHYLPLGPDSPVPTKPVSVCVALADKLDTLISMFAAGEKPTGSKDPFALRRSALGIIRIIRENNLRLPLKKFLSDELIAFFGDRLAVQLKEQGIRHDVIKAVMANGDDDLVRVVACAKALQDFLATDDGSNLLAGYKRAANIVGIEEKKDKQNYKGTIQASVLREPQEQALFEMLEKTGPHATKALEKEDFEGAMKALAGLRKPVDAFFDKVMVNADDKEIRINRLNLLARIRATLDDIANFALIEG